MKTKEQIEQKIKNIESVKLSDLKSLSMQFTSRSTSRSRNELRAKADVLKWVLDQK